MTCGYKAESLQAGRQAVTQHKSYGACWKVGLDGQNSLKV